MKSPRVVALNELCQQLDFHCGTLQLTLATCAQSLLLCVHFIHTHTRHAHWSRVSTMTKCDSLAQWKHLILHSTQHTHSATHAASARGTKDHSIASSAHGPVAGVNFASSLSAFTLKSQFHSTLPFIQLAPLVAKSKLLNALYSCHPLQLQMKVSLPSVLAKNNNNNSLTRRKRIFGSNLPVHISSWHFTCIWRQYFQAQTARNIYFCYSSLQRKRIISTQNHQEQTARIGRRGV